MQEIAHFHKIQEKTRREFSRKYCLHPKAPRGCSARVIAAHSVQRAILQKYIAEDGHVEQVKVTPQIDPVGMLVQPTKVGTRNATTFYGFCGKHDAALFLPLECAKFEFTPKQIALLGYRALCRELYLKDALIATRKAVRDYCALLPDTKGFAEKDRNHQLGQIGHINGRMNLQIAKDQFANLLDDDSDLRYYAVKFSSAPVYFCSAAFMPEWDFAGRRLQYLGSLGEFRPIIFSAWAADDRSAAVFCWHKSADDTCAQFIDSLRASAASRIADRILSMAFEFSDSVVYRSSWWNSLVERERRLMIDRAMHGIENADRPPFCLADDGLAALNSNVEAEFVGYGSK